MVNQTFSIIDIPRILTLIFLEGVLSVDNAVAIALIVRGVPRKMRHKALFIGLMSAIVLRAFGILSAAYLIRIYWVQVIGGLYLLYLSCSHLLIRHGAEVHIPVRRSFWTTVALVEMTDFIFAVDSILAGLALVGVSSIQHEFPPKIWIVYVGGIFGLIMMRFAAKLFTDIMDRFPQLEIGAHLIVGWTGLKLLSQVFLKGLPPWGELVFWIGIVLFFSFGFIKKSH